MVWSKKESVPIRVEKDLTVWNHSVERSQLFIYKIIFPELLDNYFTQQELVTRAEDMFYWNNHK